MGRFCIALLLGAFSLNLFSVLPDAFRLLAGCVLILVFMPGRSRYWSAVFLCGLVLMWLATDRQLNERLAPSLAGDTLLLDGEVVDFPVLRNGTLRFLFAPENRPDLPRKIRLGWFEPVATPRLGEYWRLQVRLKRPRGLHNPHAYDFEGWLFQKGIGATGYVDGSGSNQRLVGKEAGLVSRIRQRFVDRVTRNLPDDSATAVLMAIGVGARHNISREDWERYAGTGTSHLMAISGLHIGLAAGACYGLIWMTLAPFCRAANVRDVAVIGASFAAGSYALLAGFAVPARRAFLMILLAGIATLVRRRIAGGLVLPLAAMVIFCLDPISIHTPGFKLSFAAVAVLFSTAGLFRREVLATPRLGQVVTALHALWSIQLALLFGLFALTVLIFDRFTVVAPVVNMLVLPIFNFLTVPLCLLGLLLDGAFHSVGNLLLTLSYQSIRLALGVISVASDVAVLSFDVTALRPLLRWVALLPGLYVLLPRNWPGRGCFLLAAIAVLSFRPAGPAPGCLQYSVLDVGQGLAVVVRTQHRTLLFDTGPAFQDGSDTAMTTLLPYLRRQGVQRIDRLVVSHADLDHAGGLGTLLAGMEVLDVVAGEFIPGADTQCLAGARWEWDGVRFGFLHPRNPQNWEGNNRSCVLLIENGEHRFLLTGDIEQPVERLLSYLHALTDVNTVVVPHHGSGTSSSVGLTQAVRAEVAVVSAGFDNRWGMPKDSVVGRWQATGATVVNTATSGAIGQQFCTGQGPGELIRERHVDRKFWHDPPDQSPVRPD